MPGFYEGDPIASLSFRIEREDFIEAYCAASARKSLFGRKELRGGIFLTLILITIVAVPGSIRKYGTFYTQAALIAAFLILFWFSVFWAPAQERKTAGKIYDTGFLLRQENRTLLYRDSLIFQNEYETFSQYLSDFSFCLETGRAFVLAGGERDLLILKKPDSDEAAAEKMRESLSAFFTNRYFRESKRS